MLYILAITSDERYKDVFQTVYKNTYKAAGPGRDTAAVPAPPPKGRAPERRCSSRTFRYGYLVTT